MAGSLAVAAIALRPIGAQAHVKWFAAYDLTAPPHSPSAIASSQFAQLALFTMLALCAASWIETSKFGRSLGIGLNLLTGTIRLRTDEFLRCCLAAFFIALWSHGGIILTPELATENPWVEWLQAAIAVGMFWHRSMLLSGIGIVGLYAYGVAAYGLYHMLDYPIFLGFAAYCMLRGLSLDRTGRMPEAIVRWSIGITLMWASVEKWAYPEWTFPLLDLHSDIALGLDRKFFMNAAGMVEFGFAFALVWTPLVRRLAAIALCATFVSAIIEFGKIDAIGHMPIIAALVVIAVEPSVAMRYPRPTWLPGCFALALVGFVVAYFAAHALLMPGMITGSAHS